MSARFGAGGTVAAVLVVLLAVVACAVPAPGQAARTAGSFVDPSRGGAGYRPARHAAGHGSARRVRRGRRRELSEEARAAKPLVYVPHTKSRDVWVIDPSTFVVVARYPVGTGELQHVVPSWDMHTLYASDDKGDRLTPFDPATGTPGKPLSVTDPYNLYFTPDGRSAVSVAEAHRELVFYDPHTWAVQDTLPTPDCAGIDHADFTPDGRTAVFTCEFAGRVAVVDVAAHRLLRMIDMPQRNTMMGPQDIELAPDGSVFYIADSQQNGVWVLDGSATKVVREIPSGKGAHALPLARCDEAVRHQPARGQRQRARRLHRHTVDEVDDPGRRQPGHGQRDSGRDAAVALRPLRPQRLRAVHRGRTPDP